MCQIINSDCEYKWLALKRDFLIPSQTKNKKKRIHPLQLAHLDNAATLSDWILLRWKQPSNGTFIKAAVQRHYGRQFWALGVNFWSLRNSNREKKGWGTDPDVTAVQLTGCITDRYHQSWLHWNSLACDLSCAPHQSGWDLIILLWWDHLIGTFGSQIILLMCVRINQDAFMCGYVMAMMSHVDYFTPTHSVRGYFACKDFWGKRETIIEWV